MPILQTNNGEITVPQLSPKGYIVFDCMKQRMLLHGSRLATKSNSAQNKIIRHGFDYDDSIIGIFVKGLKAAVGTGVWEEIIGRDGIMDHWRDLYGKQVEYTKESTMDSDTKMRYFRFRNRHWNGKKSNPARGDSEVQLYTLERDDDEYLAKKLKDTRFSCIYMVEADSYENRKLIARMHEQLRLKNVPYQFRQMILDCNPPENGEDHWLYREFIRNLSGEYIPDIDPRYFELNFSIHDNPFLDPAQKQSVYDDNKHDSVDLARYYEGQWVRNNKGGIFEEQFIRNIHVIGSVEGKDSSKHSILCPGPECFEMPAGADPGDSMNHAVAFGARRIVKGLSVFDIVDEIEEVGLNLGLDEFTRMIEEKMDYWEDYMRWKRPKSKLQWRFWSDSSALRFLSAAGGGSGGSEASDILKISNGRIRLRGVSKGAGSIERRVTVLKRALFEQRMFVSAKCVRTIEMLQYLKKSKSGNEPFDPKSPYRHIFDALSYLIGYEIPLPVKPERAQENTPHLSTVQL